MFKATLMCVRATIVAVGKQQFCVFWVCVCSLRYPAFKAQAPYCHLCPAVNIFPLYLINGWIFEKTILNLKRVFWYYLQRLHEAFLILRRTERNMIRNVCWPACKVNVILVTCYWNLNCLYRFSKNTHENPISGIQDAACGRTDRRTDRLDEANICFSQFCENT